MSVVDFKAIGLLFLNATPGLIIKGPLEIKVGLDGAGTSTVAGLEQCNNSPLIPAGTSTWLALPVAIFEGFRHTLRFYRGGGGGSDHQLQQATTKNNLNLLAISFLPRLAHMIYSNRIFPDVISKLCPPPIPPPPPPEDGRQEDLEMKARRAGFGFRRTLYTWKVNYYRMVVEAALFFPLKFYLGSCWLAAHSSLSSRSNSNEGSKSLLNFIIGPSLFDHRFFAMNLLKSPNYYLALASTVVQISGAYWMGIGAQIVVPPVLEAILRRVFGMRRPLHPVARHIMTIFVTEVLVGGVFGPFSTLSIRLMGRSGLHIDKVSGQPVLGAAAGASIFSASLGSAFGAVVARAAVGALVLTPVQLLLKKLLPPPTTSTTRTTTKTSKA